MRSAVIQFGYWPASKHRELPAHRNAGLEIVWVVRGEVVWHVEQRVEVVSSGAVFFTLPWETHGSVKQIEPGCELYFVVVPLDRSYKQASRSFAFARPVGMSREMTRRIRDAILKADRRTFPATPCLTGVFPQLIRELQRPDSSADAVNAMIRVLLIELGRSARGESAARPTSDTFGRVRNFVHQLPQHCDRVWTLSDMAETCHLARSRFTEVLKQVTGDTPMMALNRARVDRAKLLLSKTNWPITRIALDCGFNNSQYFATVFREYAGQTASTFRKGGRSNASRVPAGPGRADG